MRYIALFAILGALLFSCDSNGVFEDYKTIGETGWNKDSLVVFPVMLDSTSEDFNLYINIRNNGNYPNSNIWLFVEIQSPDGEILSDTIEYTLADNRGRWLGSGIGDLFDNQFLYKRNVYFPLEGEYKFVIQHGMRTSNLRGIQDIGFRIEKTN